MSSTIIQYQGEVSDPGLSLMPYCITAAPAGYPTPGAHVLANYCYLCWEWYLLYLSRANPLRVTSVPNGTFKPKRYTIETFDGIKYTSMYWINYLLLSAMYTRDVQSNNSPIRSNYRCII